MDNLTSNNKKLLRYFKPKKYINFFKQYPRLQNLLKLKNRTTKSLLTKYYFNLVKKNKNLKNFFIDKSEEINQINFKSDDIFNDSNIVFKSLAYNGIVILEDVLNLNERENILNFFKEIENNNISSDWINREIIDASIVKYKDNENVKISYIQKKIEYLPNLLKVVNFVTNKVFGKKVNTVAEFFLHNCKDVEKLDIHEDTKFHLDRYLPCLKIVYNPDKIDISGAPFGFIKKTHKLNNKFMNSFILDSKKCFLNENQLNEELKDNIMLSTCPANSLIITFTNGLHKRNVFQKKNIRRSVFFQFTDNFNFFSLLNYKNYN